MIDLHSHILPCIDDGARSLEQSLEMARMAVDDGTTVMACTPHIYPGLYMNHAPGIRAERDKLQSALEALGIPLQLVVGADAHLVPGLLEGLRTGQVPTLNGSRYFLLEPAHHVPPPNLEDSVFQIMAGGYVPVITHPERLVWIEHHYPTLVTLARRGAWLQLTAGAVVGRFGRRARYWSERLLHEGWVHIVASDAHTTGMRNPRMSDTLPVLRRALGADEAHRLLNERPQAILDDADPATVTPVPALRQDLAAPAGGSWLGRLFRRASTGRAPC